jgi:hypothetical protein
VGVVRVQSAPVTIGARILLLAGATALWPGMGSWKCIRKRCRRHAVIDHMSGNCGFAAALVVALSRLLHSRSQSRPEPGGVQ